MKARSTLVTRAGDIRPGSWDEATRSVEVVLSSGAKVRRSDFWSGDQWDEELVVSDAAVRMDRLLQGPSLLDNHHGGPWDSVRDVVGRVLPNSAKIEGGKITARLRMSEDPAHAGLVANVRAGIVDKVSIGYRTWKFEVDKNTNPPTRRAVDWEIYEASLVCINADAGAAVRSANLANELHECELVECQREETGMDMTRMGAGASSQGEAANTNNPAGSEARSAAPAAPATTTAQLDAARAEGVQLEAQRQAGINALLRVRGLTDADAAGWRANPTLSLDQVRTAAFELLATRSDATAARLPGGLVTTGADERDKRRAAVEGALLVRVGRITREEAQRVGAHDFQGSLLRMAEEVVEREAGTRVRGRDEILRRAFMSTSDFPLILANVFSKTLRQQYQESPSSLDGWVRRTTLPDFKTASRTMLSAAPGLSKVVEGAAVQSGALTETAEGYRLDTYAVNVALTRQTIINDDLDAFTRIPSLFGAAARRKEMDLVYALLAANAAMADTVALFHATHANLVTPALGTAGALSTMRTAMRKQTGLASEKLNLAPKHLIVPTVLETLGWQLLNGEIVATQTSNANPFKGTMQLHVDARLDDTSAIIWYAACDTAQCDTIELATLEGMDGPMITQEVHNDVLGVSMQVVHDLGTKAIDHRGMIKSSGTV